MTNETLLFTAFMTGLLGNVHCIGMCGGLSSALTLSLKNKAQCKTKTIITYQIIYNLGRLSTYALLGALAGSLSQIMTTSVGPYSTQILRGFSGILMISLGLYVTGWWRGLSYVERKGAKIWQKVAPLMNKLIPVDSLLTAYCLGILWGLLPCGLIYSTLSLATSSGDPISGAFIMATFGLGTLPSMLSSGLVAHTLKTFVQQSKVQLFSGVMIIIFGLWTLAGPYIPAYLMSHNKKNTPHACH